MIGLITVFYSENCGSVLQAYALSQTLHKLEKSVVCIDTRSKYSPLTLKNLFLRVGKRFISGDFRGVNHALECHRSFSRVINEYFPFVNMNSAIKDADIDTFVLGSDTLWDVENGHFSAHPELYWPRKIGKRIVTYGVSVANTQFAQLQKLKYPKESLDTMAAISVRDQHTMNVISALTKNRIEYVCDPTLLVSRECFDSFWHEVHSEQYLAVYVFEELAEEEIIQIQNFAKSKGCLILSIGKNLSWCDKVVAATLQNFISYMSQAEYVVTNTFHGSIFSIIYQRQFVSFARKKKKVTEVLQNLGLELCLYLPGQKVSDILEGHLDYLMVEEKICLLREQSLYYLKENLW